MGLIKAEHAPRSMTPFSMKDIEDAARMILLRAQAQARDLLAQATQEAEALRQNAHVEGFAQGRSDGLAKGLEEGHAAGRQAALDEQRARLSELIQGLAAAAAEIDASRRRLEADALRDVIGLAVSIASRITKRMGLLDPQVLTENMAAAMKVVVASDDLRIAINPVQKQSLVDALPRLQLDWPNLAHVELIEDEKIAPGGCRVFTRQGIVDADLDEQLNRIAMDLVPAGDPSSQPNP